MRWRWPPDRFAGSIGMLKLTSCNPTKSSRRAGSKRLLQLSVVGMRSSHQQVVLQCAEEQIGVDDTNDTACIRKNSAKTLISTIRWDLWPGI